MARQKKDPPLSATFVEEVRKMSAPQVLKRFVQEENDIKALQEQKKGDSTLKQLRKDVKEAEADIAEELKELREKAKDLRDGQDGLDDLKATKKDLEQGYNGELKRRRSERDHLFKQVQFTHGL